MRIQFPSDDEVTAAVRQRLHGHFDYSNRLLRYWLGADIDSGLNESNLPPIVLRVILSMNVKACRQFRSVIELCERAEPVDASVIARSMFETALVIGFVLKPRFVPRRFNKEGKAFARIGPSDVTLSRAFRATLFIAHRVFQPELYADRHKARPGMKRLARRIMKRTATDGIGEMYKDQLGPHWTKILFHQPWTYSGLSISNLARSFGGPFPRWYDVVYGRQSEHVHPGDMWHHMQMLEDGSTRPTWHGSIEEVRGTLETAITMFYANIGILDEHIDFGGRVSTALYAFYREYRELIRTETEG